MARARVLPFAFVVALGCEPFTSETPPAEPETPGPPSTTAAPPSPTSTSPLVDGGGPGPGVTPDAGLEKPCSAPGAFVAGEVMSGPATLLNSGTVAYGYKSQGGGPVSCVFVRLAQVSNNATIDVGVYDEAGGNGPNVLRAKGSIAPDGVGLYGVAVEPPFMAAEGERIWIAVAAVTGSISVLDRNEASCTNEGAFLRRSEQRTLLGTFEVGLIDTNRCRMTAWATGLP